VDEATGHFADSLRSGERSYLRQKVDEATGHFANSPRSGERSYLRQKVDEATAHFANSPRSGERSYRFARKTLETMIRQYDSSRKSLSIM
jgi:ribosomal protein L37E